MRVFVTVGATSPFDSLIETILKDDVLAILKKKGYDKVVIQAGPSGRFGDTVEQRGGVSIEIWQLKSSLQADFAQSDMIISHAGSGSILDALREQKTLIVVPNPTLLHGHQSELALALEKRGYLKSSTLSSLTSTIANLNEKGLMPFPKSDGYKFKTILDEEMGYEP